MNAEMSKTKFIYQFTDKLNLKNPNKNTALANLSIYYTWKNIKSECNSKKFKISAPTWNDEFGLPIFKLYGATFYEKGTGSLPTPLFMTN